jgi:hypothetical protein
MPLSRLHFVAPFIVALVGFDVHVAQAACIGDEDCEKGFTCAPSSGGCAVAPCRPGGECPTPEACKVDAARECILVTDCHSDDDCADGTVCFESSATVCTGVAYPCEANGYCPPSPPETCTTFTSQQCTPRYLLPCESASDCGEGFRCEAQTVCTQAGIDVSGPAMVANAGTEGGAPPANAASDSTPDDSPGVGIPAECRPSDSKACQVIVKECSSRADCPSGWSCEALPVPLCATPTPAPGQVLDVSAEGNCPPPAPGPFTCVPPYGAPARGAVPSAATDTPTQGLSTAVVASDALAPSTPPVPTTPATNASSGTPGLDESQAALDGASCAMNSASAPFRGSLLAGAAALLLLGTRRRTNSSRSRSSTESRRFLRSSVRCGQKRVQSTAPP